MLTYYDLFTRSYQVSATRMTLVGDFPDICSSHLALLTLFKFRFIHFSCLSSRVAGNYTFLVNNCSCCF